MRVIARTTLAILLAACAPVCAAPAGKANLPMKCEVERPKGGLLILCGAGLRPPMELVRKEFERRNKVPVRVVYGGSQCLLAQIAITHRSRPCDLYLPGEEFYAVQARKRGFVEKQQSVCYFVPVIMVREGNPKNIRTLRDLARPGLRIGLGEAKACAIGKTGKDLLMKHGLWEAVNKNVVMHTAMAPELGNAVKLGSIDATINWDGVATGYQDGADVITIPPKENVIVRVPLSLLNFARDKQLARKFYDFATSAEGRALFSKAHFTVDLSKPIYPHGEKE